MRTVLIILLTLLTSTIVLGQPSRWEKFGDKSFNEGDYYGAGIYYKTAFSEDSTNLNMMNKYATSLRLANNYEKAAVAYRYLKRNEYQKEEANTLYYLGTMYMHIEKYANAIKTLTNYLKLRPKDESMVDKAKILINSCKWAASRIEQETKTEIILPDLRLNSHLSEFGGSFYNDTLFVFTTFTYDSVGDDYTAYGDLTVGLNSSRYKQKDYYYKRIEFDTLGSSKTQIANANFLPSENLMVYSKCNGGNNCDIVLAEMSSTTITNHKTLLKNGNYKGHITHPSLANIASNLYLFFSWNQNENETNYDIYYGVIENNKVKDVKALGSQINTIGNQVTPFVTNDSNIIYFSSDMHDGFGGYDVYKSYGFPDSLTQPKNLLKPINSAANDLYFSKYPNQSMAVVTSNRSDGFHQKGNNCCNDIYWAFYDTIKPIETEEPELKPELITEILNTKIDSDTIDSLSVSLYFPNNYPNIYNSNTKAYNEALTEYNSQQSEYKKLLDNVTVNQFFDKLKSDYENLIEFISDTNKRVESIQMSGFSSPLAATNYNFKLSEKRIEMVIAELTKYPNFKPKLITKIPQGELMANKAVSDNLSDKKSIYSIEAMKERRIDLKVVFSK